MKINGKLILFAKSEKFSGVGSDDSGGGSAHPSPPGGYATTWFPSFSSSSSLKSIQLMKELLFCSVPHDDDDEDEWHFSLPLWIKMSAPFSSLQWKFISEEVYKRSSSIVDLWSSDDSSILNDEWSPLALHPSLKSINWIKKKILNKSINDRETSFNFNRRWNQIRRIFLQRLRSI